MAIELYINGYFNMRIFNVHTMEELTEEDLIQGVLDNLQQGEYVISLMDKKIYDINDFESPLYEILPEPTNDLTYEFNEL